jgi:hypothetical protein
MHQCAYHYIIIKMSLDTSFGILLVFKFNYTELTFFSLCKKGNNNTIFISESADQHKNSFAGYTNITELSQGYRTSPKINICFQYKYKYIYTYIISDTTVLYLSTGIPSYISVRNTQFVSNQLIWIGKI